MPKKPKTQKQPAEVIGDAETMRLATEQGCFPADDGKDKAAQSLGQRGGKARAKNLNRRQRSEIAKKAADAR
jgi:hypothetical protein